MSWAKFDDRYDDNRKVKRAWRRNRATIGLHAMAVTYSCRHRTDGLVDIDWLEEKLPAQRERDKTIAVLVELGLFEPVDGEHWIVHDFLDYNPSRQDRQEASDAARNAALVRWSQGEDAKRNADPDADRSTDGNAKRMRDPMPHPSRPVPSVADAHVMELLAEDTRPLVDPVRERLLTVAAGKPGASEPSVAAVAKALRDFPRKDFVPAAANFEHHWLHGNGARNRLKDVVRAYRNWLEREPDVLRRTAEPVAEREDDLERRLAEAEL